MVDFITIYITDEYLVNCNFLFFFIKIEIYHILIVLKKRICSCSNFSFNNFLQRKRLFISIIFLPNDDVCYNNDCLTNIFNFFYFYPRVERILTRVNLTKIITKKQADERCFIIDQQIAWHFVQISKSLSNPLPFYANQIINPVLNLMISANLFKEKFLMFVNVPLV